MVAVMNLTAFGAATWELISGRWERLSEDLVGPEHGLPVLSEVTIPTTVYGAWRIIRFQTTTV